MPPLFLAQTHVQKLRIDIVSGGKDLSHVPPVHEVIGKRTSGTMVPSCEHRLPEELDELSGAHLARCHRELAVVDRAVAGRCPSIATLYGGSDMTRLAFAPSMRRS